MSAVAATGCGGGAKPSSSGGTKGTAGVNFTVTINNQGSGTVTSVPPGINCAANSVCSATFASGTTVTLSASTSQYFNGWYGDCHGATCSVTGDADKYVVAFFSTAPQGHPNWAAGHDNKLDCTQCHGATYQGVGIAPSCTSCHANKLGGHFDASREPWSSHGGWDPACQRCHTTEGFRDYVGVDGSADYLAGTFVPTTTKKTPPADATGYAYGPLKCIACHNAVSDPTVAGITQVMFASSATAKFTVDKTTAICAQCHQGRESTTSINAKIGSTAADAVVVDSKGAAIGFVNPHYLGAAGTLFGSDVQMWAQYPSMVYTAKNEHAGVASCTFCHDAHDGSLPKDADIAAKCGKCHLNEAGVPVASFLELEEVRQFGFEGDVDGDGNATESLKAEIDGVAAKLYAAMQAYAVNVPAVSLAICYTDAYPYFYGDTNGNGTCGDAGNASATPAVPADAAFKKFTPRLLRAAFNYKWYKADPGAWAHNPRYVVEILWDGITDLNAGLVAAGQAPVAFTGKRSFNGHFGAADAASPYSAFLYDGKPVGTGFTSPDCYQCHGGKGGFATYLANAPATLTAGTTLNGVPVMNNKVTGMQCTTCHLPVDASAANFKGIRTDVTTIYFPPQKAGGNGQVSVAANTVFANAKDRVCASCHTARENTTSVNTTIGPKLANDWSISFKNPHYLGAAGVMFGSNAHMMYEYSGKTYAGYPVFWQADMAQANGPHGSPHAQNCTSCHNPQGSRHSFEIDTATTVPAGTYNGAVNTESCDQCHVQSQYGDYRLPPLKVNVTALSNLLYATIQSYTQAAKDAAVTGAKPACYSDAYPYWYDATATANCTANLTSANGAKLNPAAARAAFNYKWSKAEPGAYAHNYEYMVQGLIDSIQDLQADAAANAWATFTAQPLPVDAKTGATIVRP